MVSTLHMIMLYMSNARQLERLKGTQESARFCYHTMMKCKNEKRKVEENLYGETVKRICIRPVLENIKITSEELQPRPVEVRQPGRETEEVELNDGKKEKTVKIGSDMDLKVKVNLITLLRKNAYVFEFSIFFEKDLMYYLYKKVDILLRELICYNTL